MTHSQFDPAAQNRVPWNFGAKIGPKQPLNQKQIWAIRFFLDREERIRGRALLDLAIDSKLRGCDLVNGPDIRRRAAIKQCKTGQPVQFEIASDARDSLFAWLELRGVSVEDYMFPSRVDQSRHLSTRQYARLVDEWVTAIGLQPADYGTHSLRRTKASIISKSILNTAIRKSPARFIAYLLVRITTQLRRCGRCLLTVQEAIEIRKKNGAAREN